MTGYPWLVVFAGFELVLASCAGADQAPDASTSITVTEATSSSSTAAMTTTEVPAEGAQPIREFAFLEPGEYVTTEYEPTVIFTLEDKHLLQFVERPEFVTFTNRMLGASDRQYRRFVDFMGIWADDPPDQVLDTFVGSFFFDHEAPIPISIGGLDGVQMDGVITELRPWYQSEPIALGMLDPGPMRLLIVETTAGTVAIAIGAAPDDYDDWLATAEEILAGVRFVDPTSAS